VWIEKVQEYAIEINPTRHVKGNTLWKALAKDQQCKDCTPIVLMLSLQEPWLSNIAYFITYGECLEGLTNKEKRNLKIRALKYVIHDDVL
jgi:hypothetical protein